ncbi:MAG TPA: HD domain-containing protein [Candidatus Saccharimonadales bacterium]|jgi:hypothetical protein|nr:HD domain-containing protein [Candidatus Saccharimonadales bacterium]
MNEQLTLDRIVFTPQENEAMEEIGAAAIAVVQEDFGTGYPHFEGGVDGGLAYHNGYHSLSVANGSERMATHLGLTATAILTAREAGAAHDIVQLKPRGVMERESAGWYAEQLRGRHVPAVAIEAGSLAILGTEPVLDQQNRLTGQVVSRLEFPSRSAEQVAYSVACADLGDLYAPIGPYLGHRLWQEIKGADPHREPPMEGLVGFQRNQVFMANNYQYPHPAGEEVFGRLRSKVTRYQEDILRRLEAGEIHSWQQLLDEDLAFANRHA